MKYAGEWYTIPLGFFSFLNPLTEHAIRILANSLPLIQVIGVVLFALPHRRLRVLGGLLVSIASLTIDGVNYGAGKVDHQALSHSLPALIALGELFRDELFFVKSALCFYYLQSVSGKAISGWLSTHHFAFRDWLLLYRDFYGLTTSVGRWLLSHEIGWELGWKAFDYSVVIAEFVILLFWLAAKMNRYIAMQVLLVFHFIIFLTFGIEFTKLLLPVYWWAMREPSGQGGVNARRCWFIWGLFAITALNLLSGWIQFGALTIATLFGFLIDKQGMSGFLPGVNWDRVIGWKRPPVAAWGLYNLAALILALLGREPFPSYGGPIFPGSASYGECTGACEVTLADGSSPIMSNNDNAKLALSQLGLDSHAVATSGGLASQLKALGLDPRAWIPKIVQYLVATGRADQDGIHCLNHDFLPWKPDNMISAVEGVEKERKFNILVHWTRYGACSNK